MTALCLFLAAAEVAAAGFYLPGRGVRPLGRAGAVVASGEGDPNSLWYNPANLTFDEDYELTVDVGAIDLDFEFHRAPRTEDDREITYEPVASSAAPEFSPQILVGGPTEHDGLSWAAGVYGPYLSGSTFPEDGPQRYTVVDTKGSILAFLHAAVSYEIDEHIRVGAGVQNALASFRKVMVISGYSGLYGRPEDEDLDILSRITIEDYFAPAANAGVWVDLGPHMEAAISAQSPLRVHDGDAELRVRMPSHPSFDGARLSNDTVSAGMTLPPVLRGALRVVVDPVDVELATVWEGWSVFDELRAEPNDVDVENVYGVDSIPVEPLTIPHNYQDTFSVRLGGEWQIDQRWSLRSGYAFETAAIPDEHFSTFLSDSDKHLLAAGLSFTDERWRVDAGSGYYLLADRNISDSKERQVNPTDADNELTTVVGNGQYSSRYLVFGLGVNYRFE